MDRWYKKVAVVTGGSSGVGAACVKELATAGIIVVALSRRESIWIKFINSLTEKLRESVHHLRCDVTSENDVISAFKWIHKNLGAVHILINSAGTAESVELTGKYFTKVIQHTLETNVMGTVFCVREAFNQMRSEKVDGHIVLLNSIFGHHVPICNFGSCNIYPATKHAITAMAESYRQEFSNAGTNVKITSISPGAVNSGSLPASIRDLVDFTNLKPKDVSSAIMYCLSTPPNVQIHELKIKPLHELF